MRIALLSDIHGNSIALDAVLADIHAQGSVDAYWLLGDVDYNREAVIAAVHQVRYPGVHHVSSYLTGQQRPPWEK